MQIRQQGEQIGAEITGVDVTSLDDKGFAPIREAWLRYGVIAVRGQQLEIPDFLSYSARFGHVAEHPTTSTRHAQYPQLTVMGINKFDAKGKLIPSIYARGGHNFHTDGPYEDIPYMATQLYAVAIPSRDGDTYFSSMYAAYDAMPARLKTLLEGRRAAYGFSEKGTMKSLNEADKNRVVKMHLITPVHPETGRRSLYFDPGKIRYVEGLEGPQSDDIIAELQELMIQPGAGYTHKWQAGDVVIWDNRCLVHKAAADYPPDEDRIHWRVSILDPKLMARAAAE